MGVAAFHTAASGSVTSGKSSFTYLLKIMPGPSAANGSAARSSRNSFIILYYTVHHVDTEMRSRVNTSHLRTSPGSDRPQAHGSAGDSGLGFARSQHSL